MIPTVITLSFFVLREEGSNSGLFDEEPEIFPVINQPLRASLVLQKKEKKSRYTNIESFLGKLKIIPMVPVLAIFSVNTFPIQV